MFLIERLISIGAYIIALILVLMAILDKRTNLTKVFLFYILFLTVGGLLFVPSKEADLFRINELYLDGFAHKSFKTMMGEHFFEGSFRMDYIYYWVFAKIGIKPLLPAITSLIVYFCIFYIIVQTAKLYKVSRKNIAFATLIVMASGSYIFVISGIRSMLGCAILAFLIFREGVQRKFNLINIILYVFIAFIHNFVLILIVCRIIAQIFDKSWGIVVKMFYIMGCVLVAFGAAIVLAAKLDQLMEHIKTYVMGDVYFYFWDYLSGILYLAITVIIMFVCRKYAKGTTQKLSVLKGFLIVAIVIAVMFSFEFSIFHRTTIYMTPFVLAPYFMALLQEVEEINKIKAKKIKTSLHTWLIISLILVCVRGSLCSLKFFVL